MLMRKHWRMQLQHWYANRFRQIIREWKNSWERFRKDLSIYTEKSVKALNAAKEAIVWDLDDSRQEEVDQFAENLKAALDGLTLKPADYSAVDAALAKVSNDLSIYTEESIQPLQTAINSVESGKTILDQAEVDGWAAAIENALAGLQVRKADYSKVEEAIKKIPADLRLYTDASVKALEDAKNSVVTERPVTEQESVDGYAKKIEAAIAGLTYKDADYSKVDAAVKKIPNDLKKYTDESVKAVNDAKSSDCTRKEYHGAEDGGWLCGSAGKSDCRPETETDDCAESSEDYQRSQSVRYAGQGAFLHRRF